MTKQFTEMMADLAAGVKLSTKGKQVKTFSRGDFEDLFVAFLNESEYELTSASLKAGEMVEKVSKPVAEFRKVFYHALLDFGIDKQEAEKMLDGTYQFTKGAGSYEFVAELLFNYLDSKKFDFVTKPDFKGAIVLEEKLEEVKEFQVPKTDIKKTKRILTHRRIRAKSSAPAWSKIEIE